MDDTNQQVRLYDSSEKFIRLSVDETIANKYNHWKDWKCSAGVKNLYIDFDGNIWICNTASSFIDRFNHDNWKKLLFSKIDQFGKNIPPEWWHTGAEFLKLESEFKKNGKAYKKIIPLTEENQKNIPGFLGNIDEGFSLPKSWFTCLWNSCGCGADVVLSKVKTTMYKPMLAVTNDGWEGRDQTNVNVSDTISDPVAVELNYSMPYQILWDLSRKCNYDCSYCWPGVHNKTDTHKDYDLLINTADKIINEWSGNDTIRWNFGGGEPTLHPQFLDFMKYLKSKNQWTMVTSNGTRDHKYWKELSKYMNSILLSAHFDGLTDDKDEDRFVKNIKVICEHFDEHDDDHWLEIKLMAPPMYINRALNLKQKILNLDLLHKPGANGRAKGVVSLVPIRGMRDSGEVVKYSEHEIKLFRKQT
jgi:organic radical activating enzyme